MRGIAKGRGPDHTVGKKKDLKASADMPKLKRRIITHRFCPHCKKELNVKTFKHHRRLFFDEASNTWVVDLSTQSTMVRAQSTTLSSNTLCDSDCSSKETPMDVPASDEIELDVNTDQPIMSNDMVSEEKQDTDSEGMVYMQTVGRRIY